MATSLISPGIEVREIDLTTIIPNVATTDAALGGVFRWGEIDQRVLIDSENELFKRFGKPTNANYETFLTAASFLAYGNRLYISRAANTAGVTPDVTVTVEEANATVVLETGTTANLQSGMYAIGSSKGGLSNGATIASIINSTAFTISDTTDAVVNTTTDAIQFVTNTVFSAIANTGPVANLEYCIVKNKAHFGQKEGTFDTDVKLIARYAGEIGNSLRVSICGNSDGYSSTLNLASYGTYVTLSVNTNSNTANVSIAGDANTDNSANATAIKALINVTDLVKTGNTLIGEQYLKVTSLANTTTFGTSGTSDFITVTSGSTLVTANDTSTYQAGMQITAATTEDSFVGMIVNNVVNSTAFYLDTVPTVSVVDEEVTISPRATFQIQFEDRYSLAENYVYTTANTVLRNVPRYWEFFNLVDTAPGQSAYNIVFGNTAINNDELHVVVTDNDGKISGTPGTILEVYEGLSFATDGKTVDGGANYYQSVINDRSQYVYFVNDVTGGTSALAPNLGNSSLDVQVFDLQYGNDGKDESNIEISVLTRAYDLFADDEEFDVSLIMQGKARSFVLANYIIDNICEKRKDCIALISPQRGDVVNNPNLEQDAVVAFRNNLRSSSYGVLDSGYKYMYDLYNDVYRYVPLNGDIAGLCVRTDRVTEPWFSPAGYNRGQIKNIVKLAVNPRQAQRDVLYRAGVNPVVSWPGQGTVLFGDKTLLAKPSAFDRINVRRLFIVLEKAIKEASKYTLFELNDDFTRQQFKNLVVPYLRDVQGRRGITDFLVVCDETNNTPEIIDRNEFVGDIYIKPARSINFIQLNFVAVRTGVSFSEVVGNFG